MIKKEDNKLIIEGKLNIDEVYEEDMDGWHWIYFLEEDGGKIDYKGEIGSLLKNQSYSLTNSRPRIRITVEVLAE